MLIACVSLALVMAGEPNPVAGMAPTTSSSPSGSPATVAEARMLTERAKQEIAQEEKTWSEEIAREKEAESRRRQRYSEFNQDKLRLQQSLVEQEEKLKSLVVKMEAHQMRGKELAGRFQTLGHAVAAQARLLRVDLAKGLPYQMDKRLEQLDLLVRDIEGGNISPEEALNRLWVFHQNQRRMAQEAEVYSGDFTDDGAGSSDPMQVKYLRIGRQVLAFSSLDGTKMGIMKPEGEKFVWVREKEMDHATRQALKEAMATADGKAVPGFVPLPVWHSAFAAAASPAPAPAVKATNRAVRGQPTLETP